jgi:hypothetical protein
MGNRAFFVEADATVDAPGAANAPMPIFCRHVATDGPVLGFVRDRLTIQAQALGWTPSRDANLHLLVDGDAHHPFARAKRLSSSFPTARETFGSRRIRSSRHGLAWATAANWGFSLYGLAFVGSGAEARRILSTTRALPAGCTTTKQWSALTGLDQGRVDPRPAVLGGPHRTYRLVRQPQRSDDARVDTAGATRGGRSRQA